MNVIVIDYGLGNLWSVRNALEYVGAKVSISSDAELISGADCLVLPGVGSFGTGMRNLLQNGLRDALDYAVLKKRKPILGICLGMQLLADESEEAPDAIGLGWMPGRILKIRGESLRLPHIGFNSVFPVDGDDPFFNGTREGSDFYFVHSYHFDPQNESDVLSRTRYGVSFVSAVRRNNIVGVQFHPEKSQSNGLQFLSNFIKFSSAF